MNIIAAIRETVTETTERDGWTIVRNRITGNSTATQTFPNGTYAELSYTANVDATELLAGMVRIASGN